jgi:PAS domain S-box-containing protein
MGQSDPALEHGGTPPEQSFPVELLEAFLALTPDASVVVDEEGTIVSANEQAEALFGYEPGELRGRKVDVLVPERFRHEHRNHRAGYMAAPRAREMGAGIDLTGRRRDGSEFPVDISLAPLAGQERPLVVAAVRDSSERRAAHATAAQLAAIVRSTTDGIVSISPEGLITSWNPGAERLFEWASSDIVGSHVSALVRDAESPALEELLAEALAERVPPPKDTRWLTKHGGLLDVALSVSPLHGPLDQPLGFALLVRDITERKRAEEKLRQALDDLEQRERQQAITSEIRLSLLSGAPITQVLELACSRACDLLAAENAVVAIKDGGRLRIVASTRPHLRGVTLAMDASLAGLATKTGEAQRFSSLRDKTLFDLAPIQPVPEGPAVATPIVSGADVQGALALVRAEGAPLISDDDVLTLQSLAEQLAVALELAKGRDERELLMLAGDRERIARSLYDDVIQQLFGMGLQLQNLAGLSSDRRVIDGVAEMVDELDATIGRLRSLVFELDTKQSERPGDAGR